MQLFAAAAVARDSGERGYPGTCRERTAIGRDPRAAALPPDARVPSNSTDRIQGPAAVDLERLGDVVIRRRDGVIRLSARRGRGRCRPGHYRCGARRRPARQHALADRAAAGAGPGDRPATRICRWSSRLTARSSPNPVARCRRIYQIPPPILLIEALMLLRQRPPAELWSAKPADVLAWACQSLEYVQFHGLRCPESNGARRRDTCKSIPDCPPLHGCTKVCFERRVTTSDCEKPKDRIKAY